MTDKQTLNQNSWRNCAAPWGWAHAVASKFNNCCNNLDTIPKKKKKIYTKNIFLCHCPAVDDTDVLCVTSCKLNQRNWRNSWVIYSQLTSYLSEPRKASCLL